LRTLGKKKKKTVSAKKTGRQKGAVRKKKVHPLHMGHRRRCQGPRKVNKKKTPRGKERHQRGGEPDQNRPSHDHTLLPRHPFRGGRKPRRDPKKKDQVLALKGFLALLCKKERSQGGKSCPEKVPHGKKNKKNKGSPPRKRKKKKGKEPLEMKREERPAYRKAQPTKKGRGMRGGNGMGGEKEGKE